MRNIRFLPRRLLRYLTMNTINDAINEGRQISFQYYDYTGLKKKVLKNKGEVYKLSPYHLLWNGDYYYVIGYSEKKSKFVTFRVDRIAATPEILEKESIPQAVHTLRYIDDRLLTMPPVALMQVKKEMDHMFGIPASVFFGRKDIPLKTRISSKLAYCLQRLPSSLHKFFCSSNLTGKLKRRMTYADTYRSSEHPT